MWEEVFCGEIFFIVVFVADSPYIFLSEVAALNMRNYRARVVTEGASGCVWEGLADEAPQEVGAGWANRWRGGV